MGRDTTHTPCSRGSSGYGIPAFSKFTSVNESSAGIKLDKGKGDTKVNMLKIGVCVCLCAPQQCSSSPLALLLQQPIHRSINIPKRCNQTL